MIAQPEVLAQSLSIAAKIGQTSRRHAFQAAVRTFTRLLASVPDHDPTEFSADTIAS